MFGIFYAFYNGVMAGINGIDKGFVNSTNRARAIKKGDVTYHGRNGGEFLCENGRQVFRGTDRRTGDTVIKDFRNGKIYYNLTDVARQKQIKYYKDRGETVYSIIDKDRKLMFSHQNRTGRVTRERDIKTNHFVDKIYINQYCFYMDIFTGKLLRLTDHYQKKVEIEGIPKSCYNPLDYEEIIEIFNKRQDRLKEDPRYSYGGNDWTKHIYYLCDFHSRPLYMNKDGEFVDGLLPDKLLEAEKRYYTGVIDHSVSVFVDGFKVKI